MNLNLQKMIHLDMFKQISEFLIWVTKNRMQKDCH